MSHYIKKCRTCERVISQCRCPGPKEIQWDVCKGCKSVGYTSDQQRVANYIVEVSGGTIGGGADPIGFLIASHRALILERRESDEQG